MSDWQLLSLDSIACINPRESLPKGAVAKKVAMEVLQPFTKKIPGYSAEKFNGGTKFRNGDTLVARITPSLENGKTAFVDILDEGEVGFGSTEFIVLRAREKRTTKHFLYYLARSPEFRDIAILSMTGSSGRQRVQTEVVSNYVFAIPSLAEQEAITAVLSSLDDKIDLLHRQNKTLEALAQTLFRHWFIDVAKDFVKLTEMVEVNPTVSMRKGTLAPYLEMKNVQTDSCTPIDWYNREYNSGTRFQNGDALMARITPCLENNKVSFVNFLEDGQTGWGSTEFLVLRANDRMPKFYTYLLAKDPDFRSFAINTMTGSSGRQRVQTTSLYDYELGVPSEENLAMFKSQIAIIEQRLKLNANQIRTLGKLRDTLLPKLMSGQARVRL